ncbi:MAG: tetratricopeptide repeat protein [Tepidisphaeraceae bacterium]|jgi:predicted O-linked N-acetylglucosamine transferase (SPINDLY family)
MSPVELQKKLDLATTHHQAGRVAEAESLYLEILSLMPDQPDVLHLLGVIRQQQSRPLEALKLIGRALDLNPRQAAYHCNLGVVLTELKLRGRAKAEYRQAIQLKTDYFEAHFNLANCLMETGDPERAVASFHRAMEIRPDEFEAMGNLVYAMQCLPGADPAEIFAQHLRWGQKHADPLSGEIRPHDNSRQENRRLRIGYVSSDFREHSVAFFMEDLLANHDPKQVEVFAYADMHLTDGYTARLQTLVPQWRNVTRMSYQKVAEMIRSDGIDILVDLAGHTGGNRLLVFARKPAPIQVSYLGYPDTSGISTIDFRMTDGYADPPGMTEKYYSEKLVRLPRSFVCYKPVAEAPEVSALPALSRGWVTFGSFNALTKMNGQIVALWCRILREVPGSRILIKNAGLFDDLVKREMLERFSAGGIEASRVKLLPQVQTQAAHLKMYEEMDIALDTFPYHGTTTSCEAMWMGVPVVTLEGRRHASRVGVSLLTNLKLTELIAGEPEEYVGIAARLAGDLPRLSGLRAGLRGRMRSSPLMDGAGFAREVEAGYRQMWSQWLKSCG